MAIEDVIGGGVKMGARKVPAVSLAMFLLSVLPNAGITMYSGGSGTPDDPYLIHTAAEMNQIGLNYTDWDKNFKLMADINLAAYTGTQFNRIGTDDMHAFSGVFNGNWHTISNFTYTAPSGSYIGVFGHISATAQIKKVALVRVNVTGSESVGGLVGYNEGIISDSSVSGTVSGYSFVGGLAGYNLSGTISNCSSTAAVTGGDASAYLGCLVGYSNGTISNCFSRGTTTGGVSSNSLGGLVGQSDGSISNCHSKGAVIDGNSSNYIGGLVGVSYGPISNSFSTAVVSGGSGAYYLGGLAGYNGNTISACWAGGIVSGGSSLDSAGGLVGVNGQPGTVTNCYATGEVNAYSDVGGLVGYNYQGTIAKCCSSGKVTGSSYTGGLLGWNSSGTISNSFWDVNTSTKTWSAGGTGKSTAEMKTESTFTDAGWDFIWETANGTNDIWIICEGVSYPKLAWQSMTGDSDIDGDVDFTDFALMGRKWKQTDSNAYCGMADFTGNGFVDLDDLAVLADHWLQ